MKILDGNERSCNRCGLGKSPADLELLRHARCSLQRLNDVISDVEQWQGERSRMRILISRLQAEVARLGGNAAVTAKSDAKREIEDLKRCNRSLEKRVSELTEALSVAAETVPCRRMKKLYGMLRQLVERCAGQQSKIVALSNRVKELEEVQDLAGNVCCSDSNKLSRKPRGPPCEKKRDVRCDRQSSLSTSEVQVVSEGTESIWSEPRDCRVELNRLREMFERMQLQLLQRDETIGQLLDRNTFLNEQLTRMIIKRTESENEAKKLKKSWNELESRLRVAPEATETLTQTVETGDETTQLRCLLKQKNELTENLRTKLKDLEEKLVESGQHAARYMATATEKMVALQINKSRLSDEVNALRAENRKYRARIGEREEAVCGRNIVISCRDKSVIEDGSRSDKSKNEIYISDLVCDDHVEESSRDGREAQQEIVSNNKQERRLQDKLIENAMTESEYTSKVQTKDEETSVQIHEDKCDSQTITEMKLIDLDEMQTKMNNRTMKMIFDVERKLKLTEIALENCQKEHEESRGKVTELTVRLADAKNTVDSLQARLTAASDKEKESNFVAASLREKVEDLLAELDAERLKLNEAYENIKEFEGQACSLEVLKKELSVLRNEDAKRIAELEAKAGEAENNCEAYKKELSMREMDSKRKLSEAIDKAKKCDFKFTAMYKKLTDFAKLVADLEGKLKDEGRNLEEIENDLRSERAKSSTLENKLQNLSTEAKNVAERLKNADEENAILRANVQRMEEKLMTDETFIADLCNDLKKSGDSLKMERARFVVLERELRDRIGALLVKEKNRKSEFVGMQKELLDAEDRVFALEEGLDNAEKETSDLHRTLRTERDKFTVEIDKMRSEVNEARNDLKVERANCSAFEEKVKNQLRKTLDKAKDCEIKFAVLRGKVVDAEERAADMRKKLAAKEAEGAERIAELEFILKQTKDELSFCKARVIELEADAERLSSSVNNLQEELKEAIERKAALEEKLNSAEEYLKTERNESANLRGELNRLENNFESAKREAQLANASLKQLIAKGAGDGIKLVELESKLRQADEAVKKLMALLKNNATDTAPKSTQASVVTTDTGQAPEEVVRASKRTQIRRDRGTDVGQMTELNDKVSRSTVVEIPFATTSSQTFEPPRQESKSVEVRTISRSTVSQTPDEARVTSKGTGTAAVDVRERGEETERIEKAAKNVETERVNTVESGQTPVGVEKASKGSDVDKPRSVAVGQVTEVAVQSSVGIGMTGAYKDFGQDPERNERPSRAIETERTEKRNFGGTTESVDTAFKGIQVGVESGQVGPDGIEKVSRGTDANGIKAAAGSVIIVDIDKTSKAIEVERTPLKGVAENTEEPTTNYETIENKVGETIDGIDMTSASVRTRKRSLSGLGRTQLDSTKENEVMKGISGEIQRKEVRASDPDRAPSEMRKYSKPTRSGQTKALRSGELSDKVNAKEVLKSREPCEEAVKREKPIKEILRVVDTKDSMDSAKDNEGYLKSRVEEARDWKNRARSLEEENEIPKRRVLSRKSSEPFNMEGWLQSLTLTELAELHDRLCDVTGRLIEQDIMMDNKGILYEYLEPGCYCPGLGPSNTNYYTCVNPPTVRRLNTKIAALQKEIHRREYEAEAKMDGLVRAIQRGQLRLLNLKDEIYTYGRFDYKTR